MAQPPTTVTITPAERIRELSEINKDVATLLTSAGQAVHALTDRPLNLHASFYDDTPMPDTSSDSLEARREKFKEVSTSFFETLQGVTARLRRQVYALEEAGIITPDPLTAQEQPKAAAASTAPAQSNQRGVVQLPKEQQLDPDRIKNGGLGDLDIGWLNSRSNKVGAEKEAELIQEAKELLQDVLRSDEAGG